MPSVKLSVVRVSALAWLLTCATLGLASGCGGDERAVSSDQAKADAELAQAIEASARRRERERGQQETTLPPASATTTPADGSTGGLVLQPRRPRQLLSAADRASFTRLAAQLPGDEGFAVATLGRGRPVARAGSLRSGVAWSTAKVPVAMAAIAAGVAQSQDLTQAITASDNEAAGRLWSALGEGTSAADAATAQLREAGDARTQIQAQRLRSEYTAFGQTQWALTDQVRFVGGMACVAAGQQVLELMNQVVAGQRWGLGATGKPAQFKAGWGPGVTAGAGDGWLDRQMGLVAISGRRVAVAMATTAPSHESGIQSLSAIARWVVTHVDASVAPREPRC